MSDGSDTEQFSLELSQLAELDRVCDAFEVQWRTGEPPDLADFVQQHDAALRPALLRHLLPIEIEYRRQQSKAPSKALYAALHRDFPQVFAEVWANAFQENTATGDIETRVETSDPSSRPILIGTRIGRFRIVEELGSGGFGSVYRAHDEDLQRDVALKVAHQDKSRVSSSDTADAQLHEARVAAKLDHPAIVPVLEVGRALGGRLYVVSKLILGSDLRQRLDDFAYLPDEAVRLVAAMGEALDHAHRHGLVHRDVKPANILIDQDHRPFLTDFGLALREEDTGTGAKFAGSPAYMSPEQARSEGHLVDARSDVFSLSVILYEMLTGQRPFRGPTRVELLNDICRAAPPAPQELVTDLSPELQRIVLRGLAGRASDRYPSAAAMVEDLRAWLGHSAALSEATPRLEQVMVQPKGLRSFDENDAHFFGRLIPGPRDRHGVPEALAFWQRRIESRDPRQAFRVGVLYGPSGSGKSSLTEAGLIPLLDNSVLVCLVTATPGDTEAQLLHELRRQLPALARCESLVDAVRMLRGGGGMSSESKVLLLIDHFEQWLSGNSDASASALAAALRQCDGVHVQALLLVRVDYWYGLSQFLQQVEVSLDAENSRLAPIFDAKHAERVLREFGEAYGRVSSEQLTPEQEGFIQNAVQEMSLRGQMVPVRLALLAEVFKNRDWSAVELQRLGGVNGAVSMFLDGIVFGPSAHPSLKRHPDETVRVLRGLLPPPGSSIKGQPRSCRELSELAGIGSSSVVEEILGALAADYRLVTSLESASDDREATTQYQLSHDFLVPIVRDWAALRQRDTYRGRVEYLLSDRTEAWQHAEEKRSLPSLVEWLAIQVMTQRARWSAASRRMMRAANRHHGSRLTAVAVVILITLWTVNYLIDDNRARALRDRLLAAETSEVPVIIDEIDAAGRQAQRLLRREWDSLVTRPAAETEREFRRRLHLALARFKSDDSLQDFLVGDGLDRAEPREIEIVARTLLSSPEDAASKLAVRLASSEDNDQLLRAASALATVSPAADAWTTATPSVALALVSARPIDLQTWSRNLQPVAATLLPPLFKLFGEDAALNDAQQLALADVFATFAHDRPDLLLTAVAQAQPAQLAALVQPLQPGDGEAIAVAEKMLAALVTPPTPAKAWPALDPTVTSMIEEHGGYIGDDCAFVQRLPKEAAADVVERMADAGYSLHSYRPFAVEDGTYIGAAWRRDGSKSLVEIHNSITEFIRANMAQEEKGLFLSDVTYYLAGEPQYVGTWKASASPRREVFVYLDATFGEHRQLVADFKDRELTITRFFARSDSDGSPLYSAIWRDPRSKTQEAPEIHIEYAGDFKNAFIGYLQTDCQFCCLDLERNDQFRIRKLLARGTRSQISNAYANLVIGNSEFSEDLLEQSGPSEPTAVWTDYLVRSLVAQRDCQRAQATLDELAGDSNTSDRIALMQIRCDLCKGDPEEAVRQLDQLEQLVEHGNGNKYLLARAHALVADYFGDRNPERAAVHMFRAIGILFEQSDAVVRNSLEDPDFNALRSSREYRELVDQRGFGIRYSATWTDTCSVRSELIAGVPAEAHAAAVQPLIADGYYPHCISSRYSEVKQGVVTSSVWHKEFEAVAAAADRASAQANLLIVLAKLGRPSAMIAALQDEFGRQTRSYVMERGSLAKIPVPMISTLGLRHEHQEVRRNALLMLGAYAFTTFDDQTELQLLSEVKSMETSTVAGIRSAASYCLRRWQNLGDRQQTSASGSGVDANHVAGGDGCHWYLNSLDQTMIRVAATGRTLFGSPSWEADRAYSETQHVGTVERAFYLAATETTVGQFKKFLADPQVRQHYEKRKPFLYTPRFAPGDDCPQTAVRYYDAVRFCQWLSEREKIPKDQWCYPGIWDANDGEYSAPVDCLLRTGYRLPTEHEWEVACRAQSTFSRYYGDANELLPAYAWGYQNALDRSHPVGRLKPNQFGFYDTLGNVAEWCHDAYRGWDEKIDPGVDGRLTQETPRVVRGASFIAHPRELRSARRQRVLPAEKHPYLGLRVAKTL